MSDNTTTKPKNVDYFRVPRPLWRSICRLLSKEPAKPSGGRPRADARGIERDLVCAMDGLPMESSASGLVWTMQQHPA